MSCSLVINIFTFSMQEETIWLESPKILKKRLRESQFAKFAAATKVADELGNREASIIHIAFVLEKCWSDYARIYPQQQQEWGEIDRNKPQIVKILVGDEGFVQAFKQFEERVNIVDVITK